MSYVSLLKNIPEILSQPTGIAAIASLGIHGAIALIVPLMPVNSSKSQDSASAKTVGVLELSQADQSRLPQTPDMPQVGLQPQPSLQAQLPLQTQLTPPNLGAQTTVLPPLPPSSMPLTLPPIPTGADNYRISSLPKGQSLRMIPRGDLRFDNSGFNATKRRFTSSSPSFNDREIATASKPLPVDKLPELQSAPIPGDLPNTPSPNLTEIPTSDNNNPTPQTTQPGNDASKVAQNQPLIAPIGQTPKVGDNLILGRQSIPQGQQGSTSNIPELPSKASEQPLIAQVNTYANLRKTVQQQYPNSEEKAVIRETIATNKSGSEGTIWGFLVVDTFGKVLDIKFQDKSASPGLQLKAREYFNTNSPKADKKISRYPFRLRFQNNSSNTAGTIAEPTPAAITPKPSSIPGVNGKPASLPTEAAKPLPDMQIRKDQPTPSPAVTIQPSPTPIPTPTSTPTANSNQLSPSVESGEKLIQKLREARKQIPSPNPTK
jgi:hypothetical protein